MNKNKIWKTIAIIFMAIFLVMILAFAHKAYRFKTSFTPVSKTDIELAKTIVQKDLEKTGEKITDYEIKPARKSRHFERDAVPKRIISVILNKDSTTHSYLVDLDSGEILMRSKTEFSGWMKKSNKFRKHYG